LKVNIKIEIRRIPADHFGSTVLMENEDHLTEASRAGRVARGTTTIDEPR
jgi:hypothetical protein